MGIADAAEVLCSTIDLEDEDGKRKSQATLLYRVGRPF